MQSAIRSCASTASLLACLLTTNLGRANESPPRELRYSLPLDLTLATTGAALWVASEWQKSALATNQCRWCGRNSQGQDTVNGVDAGIRDTLVWSDKKSANVTSNWLAFALAPVTTLGMTSLLAWKSGAGSRMIAEDAVIIAEASLLAMDFNQLTKFIAGRERPFAHELRSRQSGIVSEPTDNHLSFFSGHTTWAFALATAGGTVASMRGYDLAPLVWAIGLPLATLTGYLRVAADKHYFTDVIVGAAVGSAFGVGLPLLAHGPQTTGTSSQAQGIALSRMPSIGPGPTLSISGVW